jgi:hypothetical protein
MGAEAMGITQQNVDWWDEKVCRNYLFGTCPHILFGNTVSIECRVSASRVESKRTIRTTLSFAPRVAENGPRYLPQTPLRADPQTVPRTCRGQSLRPPRRRLPPRAREQPLRLCGRRGSADPGCAEKVGEDARGEQEDSGSGAWERTSLCGLFICPDADQSDSPLDRLIDPPLPLRSHRPAAPPSVNPPHRSTHPWTPLVRV